MKKFFLMLILTITILFSGCTSTNVAVTPDNLNNLESAEVTPYNELIVGNKFNKFNLKSRDSPSRLRDKINTSSSGSLTNKDGELYIQTGSTSNGFAEISTRERGQYISGTTGLAGLGVRVPKKPTGNQYAEWGYFDTNNGFGFGVNATCTYIFILDDSNKKKVCQDNWNNDVMDGTGDSGHKLDLADGNIYQIPFQWYGYGSINFVINTDKGNINSTKINHRVHTTNIYENVSIEDPNQPITVMASNGGTASNLEVYIGGRQFSITGANSVAPNRPVSAILEEYTVTNGNNWTPLIAVKKSDLHPLTNDKNSINVIFKDFQVQDISDNLKLRVTYDGDITGGTFNPAGSWAGETGAEVSTIKDGLSVNSSNQGLVISRILVTPTTTGAKSSRIDNVERSQRITIGEDAPVIIWGQKANTNDVTIGATIINWLEEW